MSTSSLSITFISGIGFLADSYDIFIISLSVEILAHLYFSSSSLPPIYDNFLKASSLIGTFLGQIIFGYLGDKLGRKRIYGFELLVVIVATTLSAFCFDLSSHINLFTMLILFRFILGIGIGGDYPLSATVASEFSNTKNRGAVIASVFAMQGVGIILASCVCLIVLRIFKHPIDNNIKNLDYAWRLMILIGVLPSLCMVYYRFKLEETPHFQHMRDNKEEERNFLDENQIKKQVNHSFIEFFSKWNNFKLLFATSFSWFCLDVAFYGVNLNAPLILNSIGFSSQTDVYKSLFNASLGNLIICLMGGFPGYWATVLFIDSIGRRKIQILGFFASASLFFIMGCNFGGLKNEYSPFFIMIFTLNNFFFNFGPNVTTFIIPAEVFPTEFRARCHGISAAFGKLGAILAQFGFSILRNNRIGMGGVMNILGGFMLAGGAVSFAIKEMKGKELNEEKHVK